MNIGNEIIVAHNGACRKAVFCGISPTGRVTVRFHDDGSVKTFARHKVKQRRRHRKVDTERLLRNRVLAVVAEFRETVQRPPTAREMEAWLPCDWALPLARKMGVIA